MVAAILTDKHGSPCDTLYHVCLVLPLHEPTVVGDIDNKYEGEPGKHADALFKKAEQNKPCVIFFDEADSLYCIAKVLILTAGVMMIVSTGQLLQKWQIVGEFTGKIDRIPGIPGTFVYRSTV